MYITNDDLVDWYFNRDFTHSNVDSTNKNDSPVGISMLAMIAGGAQLDNSTVRACHP